MAKVERSWNSFVRSLIQTKDAWERVRVLMEGRPNIDHINPQAQKYLTAPFSRAIFFKAMPEFFSLYGYKRSDLRDLLVSESSKDEPKTDYKVKEKKDDGARAGL